jgi:hypothetical protein
VRHSGDRQRSGVSAEEGHADEDGRVDEQGKEPLIVQLLQLSIREEDNDDRGEGGRPDDQGPPVSDFDLANCRYAGRSLAAYDRW